jgi:hypothetical protein
MGFMKKIDKTNCIAKEYYEWQLNNRSPYYSSHKYYKDVLIALLNCQEGLCAYTEYRLIEKDKINMLSKAFEIDFKYIGDRPESPSDNEHFNSNLKKRNGWAWDNFFAVFSPINRDIKRVRELEVGKNLSWKEMQILKPDTKDYDPYKFLEYDIDEHMFYPNRDLDPKTMATVKDIIYVLGLNYGFIRMKRKEYLSTKIAEYLINPSVEIDQFPTSFNMATKD